MRTSSAVFIGSPLFSLGMASARTIQLVTMEMLPGLTRLRQSNLGPNPLRIHPLPALRLHSPTFANPPHCQQWNPFFLPCLHTTEAPLRVPPATSLPPTSPPA